MIKSDSKVTLHFSLMLDNGDVIDSTFEKKPASFVMGDGSLLPGFEEALLGLAPSDKKTAIIEPAKAFGVHNPENMQHFKRSDFAEDAELSPGTMFSFADVGGNELPGVLDRVEGERVFIDFNHPLAGRNITFTVEIFDVE